MMNVACSQVAFRPRQLGHRAGDQACSNRSARVETGQSPLRSTHQALRGGDLVSAVTLGVGPWRVIVKNHECEIHFVTASGWTQTVRKRGPGGPWIQTTNGVEREMTAEQLLSHVLPALVYMQQGQERPRARVLVVPDPQQDTGQDPRASEIKARRA